MLGGRVQDYKEGGRFGIRAQRGPSRGTDILDMYRQLVSRSQMYGQMTSSIVDDLNHTDTHRSDKSMKTNSFSAAPLTFSELVWHDKKAFFEGRTVGPSPAELQLRKVGQVLCSHQSKLIRV